MRRVALFLLLFALLFSFAVPTGTVFASNEELVATDSPETANQFVAEGASAEDTLAESAAGAKETTEASAQEVKTALLSEDETVAPITIEVPEQPTETPLPPQRKVYVTALQSTNALGFVELYNADTKTHSIATWRMKVEFADGGEPCEVDLDGYILAKSKVLLARAGMAGVENAHTFICGESSRVVTKLLLYDGDQVIEQLLLPRTDDQVWHRRSTTSTYTTGVFSQDFTALNPAKPYVVTDGYWYVPPPPPGIQVLEVYVNPRTCLPPDTSADCYDYVKVKNTSQSESVDLSDYRLRSGFSNSAASTSNTVYSSVVLAPGQVRTLTHGDDGERITLTANDGTVWFEDVEGMVAYPSDVAPYVGSGLTSVKGRSWAYNDRTKQWQWATPAPHAATNNFTVIEQPGKGSLQAPRELVACRKDQYRSQETNRCRSIATPAVLKPCREGQYRSEETNRCRSITATVVGVLKPCAEGQFRNPLTNRCKKIASTEDLALADCGEGRERNPATNRCRNVLTAGTLTDTMPFPVEETAEGNESFTGWWVLSIVTLLGVSYGVWEWRAEIVQGGHRLNQFIRRSK